MGFLFESLEVYKRALDLAEKVSSLTETFPPKKHHHLADQLRRASLSVSLNIAEGNGRWHAKERKNFFWVGLVPGLRFAISHLGRQALEAGRGQARKGRV